MKRKPLSLFELAALVWIVCWLVAILSSCSVINRTKSSQSQKSDSTAQTQTIITQVSKKDSTGTTQKVDSGAKQSWWQSESETTTVETIDSTTGRVINRTTTRREKKSGHQEQKQFAGITDHSQIKTVDSTAAAAAAKTSVKKEAHATTRATHRMGTPVMVVVAVVIILVVFIWTHWDDLVLALFRKRKT